MENLILSKVTDPYIILAMGIVRQAVNDYRRAYLESLLHGEKTAELKELERWFVSDWGQECSLGNGVRILKDTQADCELRYSYSYDKHDLLITWQGEVKTLKEWAAHLGMGKTTLYNRLVRGWSLEDAMTRPVRRRSRGNHKEAV
jgi:hypothetical protein